MQIHLASNNQKKAKELQRVLQAAGISGVEILLMADVAPYAEPIEDGRSFEDNALIKARAGAAATGVPTLADDSGLAVDELNGMPGVLSARWSGRHGDDEANNDLLLGQMAHVPDERRGCGFVSVCALVLPSGEEHVARGEWRGTLLRERRGDGGFGYDPLFLPEDADGRASAELTPEEKDARSHRGKALAQLVPVIAGLV
ncbi:RdgB/HAM1 family non-canonical purine NTP pyrophosphatase [Corynebacterium epidermidicanis]|uniref:dITP/XTP pyrophosphatase n=1 Tax=Corynebacterium epidermidicanis TaxID=1050174 RepID=A0A0G3GRV1_9CORY|nr:RdgB/HAM1 family non-canonical purine NTP pyrophosphatase [Corynebacterium epidermidicanis]AKK03849.1 non-canonical purine NTP pyrophosphatase, RdgB/HAM1 family [Corynebacterium epidermidicanis]